MYHLKHILITPMIKFFRYRIFLIIACVIISNNLQAEDVVVAEVTVKDYSFMNDLANLIDKTSEITKQDIKKYGKDLKYHRVMLRQTTLFLHFHFILKDHIRFS